MPVLIKNQNTGEVKKVQNAGRNGNGLWVKIRGQEPGDGWFKHYPMLSRGEFIGDRRYMNLADGWTFAEPERKPRKPRTKAEPAPEPLPVPVPEPEPEDDFVEVEVVDEVVGEPAPEPAPAPDDVSAEDAEFLRLLRKMRGDSPAPAAIDEAKVAEVAKRVLGDLLAETSDAEKARAARLARKGRKGDTEVFHAEFDDIVQDVADGFAVYLYGPAGTGKSHTAKQVADALGLPYYELTQLQYAHEVKGYGDAGGNYVSTPAYKAMTEGGLLFLDEWDRSAIEATTTINTFLANGHGDIPVIGNITVHPNFRVMAAGNTTMQGGDDEYTSANQIDASTRDRFAFYKVDYDRRVEGFICDNDKDLLDFMAAVRKAVSQSGISCVVSYRATKYLHARRDKSDLAAVLMRGMFKGMVVDDIRAIYGAMTECKYSKWGKAMGKLCGF